MGLTCTAIQVATQEELPPGTIVHRESHIDAGIRWLTLPCTEHHKHYLFWPWLAPDYIECHALALCTGDIHVDVYDT